MKRPKRKGECTCRCTAYKFPHRFGGGKCNGFYIVWNQWNTYYGSGDCENCMSKNNENNTCQVVEGIERVEECEVFQEFVAYEEIKLYTK